MIANIHFQSGGGGVKPFVCECGEPAVARTSNREPICDRCLKLERAARSLNTANKLVGIPQDSRQQNQLPAYHLVEAEPIAGGSLVVLNLMLASSGK